MPRRGSNKNGRFRRDVKGRRVASKPVVLSPENLDLPQVGASSDDIAMDIEAEVGGAINADGDDGDDDWRDGAADNPSGGSQARLQFGLAAAAAPRTVVSAATGSVMPEEKALSAAQESRTRSVRKAAKAFAEWKTKVVKEKGEAPRKSAPSLYLSRKAWEKLRLGLRCSFSDPIFIYIGYVRCQVVFAADAEG